MHSTNQLLNLSLHPNTIQSLQAILRRMITTSSENAALFTEVTKSHLLKNYPSYDKIMDVSLYTGIEPLDSVLEPKPLAMSLVKRARVLSGCGESSLHSPYVNTLILILIQV